MYYNKFRELTDPAAAFVWQKLTVAGTFIAETTKPARNYLNKKIPQLLEKVRCSLTIIALEKKARHFLNPMRWLTCLVDSNFFIYNHLVIKERNFMTLSLNLAFGIKLTVTGHSCKQTALLTAALQSNV